MPTKQPTDLEVVWVAGVFEGEGTAYEQKTGCVTVSIPQKDPEILYRVRDWFGGRVWLYERGTWKNKMNPIYRWSLSGDRARLFLQLVYEFCSARRKEQIDRTSYRKFTGLTHDTRPPMDPRRVELRENMTAKQKMVESQIHYRERNGEMVRGYQRDLARRKAATERAETISVQ